MDKSTVKEFEIDKYLGTWYEIARFDHKFERGLQGVTTSYLRQNDGSIKVLNQGFYNSLKGKRFQAEGRAKLTNKTGILKVSFFWILYADYLIMELDKNYQWALIGSKSDNYLWILSKTPELKENTKSFILEKAIKRGYDVSKLIWVVQ